MRIKKFFNNNRKQILILFLFFSFILLISPVFAEESLTLPDPLNHRDIPTLVTDIIKYVLRMVGVLALAMFIYGGVIWMTSGGSEKQIKKGKDTLVWAIFGLAIIFFSYAILDFVIKILLK